MEYIRLTKKQQDSTGHSIITCRFKDTNQCPIHNCGNCGNCSMFNQMLEQLNEFENILEESMMCEVKSNTAN